MRWWLAAFLTALPWPPIRGGLRPAPPPGGDAVADCGACHVAEADEWRGSRHAIASSNPMFRASWDRAPDGWCLGCHEPLVRGQEALIGAPAAPGHDRPATGAGEGVSCAACHVEDGVILTGADPSERARRAHPVRATPDLGHALCARCHEFPFQNHTPKGPFTLGDEPAQATWTEWRGSAAAARGATCATCHLPGGDHRFAGAHRGDLWDGLLDVDVAAADGVATVTLSGSLPHAVPTGDPFRRLELRLCGDRRCDDVVGVVELRRVYAPDATTWRLRSDTTLPVGDPSRISHPTPISAPPVAWELWLLYGERALEAGLPSDEVGRRVDAGRLR